MRKINALLLILILPVLLFSCKKYDFIDSTYKVKLSCENGFIYNYNTDEIKYIGDENSKIYPASTTKLLTALAALEILSPDTLITPGDEVYLPPDGSSIAYIRPNHTLSLEMLIEAMIIPSGNDAAYAAAAACGYELGSENLNYEEAVNAFVEYMNSFAESLGCTGTHFTSPDGYADSEHYSTTHDMAVIAKAASENEIIMKYASLPTDDVVYASGHTNTWINTNKLLDKDSDYYNQFVIGLKTGSLEDSYSLITLFDDGNNRLLVGLFGEKKDADRYQDTLNIIEGECAVAAYN